MKFGPAHGTPEEIKKFIDLNGLDIDNYLEKSPEPSNWFWILPPVILLAAILGVILFMPGLSARQLLMLLVIATALDIWSACAVHLCWRNKFVTWIAAIGGFAMILIAVGVLSPSEVLKIFKQKLE